MADIGNNGALKLSATDLKNLTNWTDPVIQEFLSLTKTMSEIIIISNTTNNYLTTVMSQEGQNSAYLNTLRKNFTELQEKVATLNAALTKIATTRTDLTRAINQVDERLSIVGTLVSKVSNLKRDLTRLIDNRREETSAINAADARITARLDREIAARKDLEQVVYS